MNNNKHNEIMQRNTNFEFTKKKPIKNEFENVNSSKGNFLQKY